MFKDYHRLIMNWSRFTAILIKEFIQMRRDRMTFAMMIGIPLLQLILFGFAINTDPRHLPTVVLSKDDNRYTRRFLSAMTDSGYFNTQRNITTHQEAERLLKLGKIQFILTIPAEFTNKLLEGERPTMLMEADATDPVATTTALTVLNNLSQTLLNNELPEHLGYLRSQPPPFELRIERRFNPDGITAFNIVPGLIGVILTMAMVTMTALAVTRERERGTMETLLASPVKPVEVILGKLIPYIIIGYAQVLLILLAMRFAFHIPVQGSLPFLLLAVLLFIVTNLMIGMALSTLARNQMQAMQMTFFFFLPSMLLSGFMFPFRGMPEWAQGIGEILPLTHFLRLVRGVVLKGAVWQDSLIHFWPILLFLLVITILTLLLYRRTLD